MSSSSSKPVVQGADRVPNYVDGKFVVSNAQEWIDLHNPATGEVIGHCPIGTAQDVDAAVKAARAAFPGWRATPPQQRAKFLFKLQALLEEHFEELSAICTMEHGKTLAESRGDVRRMIDNVEVACGIPSMMMGQSLEDVSRGIDTVAFRQPVGVFAAIAPFNFPAMVPFWFLPFAIATGNTFIVKPSEQVPLSQLRAAQIIDKLGLPKGVVNYVNGGKPVVDAIINHPGIDGVSFVGSSPVAHIVYKTCAQNGKRVQALGGAKNFIVAMDDLKSEAAFQNIVDSCMGCAGQRCLAGSVIVGVGKGYDEVVKRVVEAAKKVKTGNGMDESVGMGPVISARAKERILAYIEKGIAEGAKLAVDGRGVKVPGGENGYFVGPTVFTDVTPAMTIAKDEIFGPVVAIVKAKDLNEAIEMMQAHPYANAASIFTDSGKAAREFVYRTHSSMVGVNIGVAAPAAFFTFGGAKGSFYGDLKAHGRESILFYTDGKTAITRWY
jgi:malonate-semialdehyde dehydrogenase (acetylating)/methylmalonate-semialdehyde dehydrogenase